MPQIPKVFTPATSLASSANIVYQQAANSVGQVLRAVAYNTDTVPRQLTVYRVPAGGAPGATSILLSGAGGRIMAGQELIVNGLSGMVLNPGDAIWAMADAAAVMNFFMSGYEST